MGDAPEDDPRTHPMKVQGALEALLSKKNLGKDPHLRSAINPQMYLPVITLVAHEKMAELNATQEEIIEAAQRSHRLGFDEKTLMIRPMLKSKRNTLILRDIPDDAAEEEIRALFDKEGAPKMPVGVKRDINQTWFVKMEADENPADVALWLRGQQLRGRPVQCAVKSEYFLRSFFPLLQHSVFPSYAQEQSQPLPLSFPMRSLVVPWSGMPACAEPNVLMDASLMAQVNGIEHDPSLALAPSAPTGYWKPWGRERPPLCLTPEAPAAPASEKTTDDATAHATAPASRRSAWRSRQWKQWQPQQTWQTQWQPYQQWQQGHNRQQSNRRWWDSKNAFTQQGNVNWVSGYKAWGKKEKGAVDEKKSQQEVAPPPPPALSTATLSQAEEAAPTASASQKSTCRNKKRKEAAMKKWQMKDSEVDATAPTSPVQATEKQLSLLTLAESPEKVASRAAVVGYQTKYTTYETKEIMDIGKKGIASIASGVPSGVVQDADVFATAQEPAWVSQEG